MSTSVSAAAAAALLPTLTGRRSPPASRVPAIFCRRIGPRPRLFSSCSLPFPIRPAAAMATDGAAPAKQKLLIFDTKEDLAVSLAKYTADLSKKFAAERGAFTVVLSGGSLIDALRLFDASPTPHKSRLCWFLRLYGSLRDLLVSQQADGAAVPRIGGLEQVARLLGG